MSFLDKATGIAKTIAEKGVPILAAAATGNPVAVMAMLANAFNANPNDPQDIINKINLDPNAQIKLAEIQATHQVELEKIALSYTQEENKDRADARKANVDNKKLSDEWIKAYLLVSVTLIIFACLYALITQSITGEESNIVSSILGSSFTCLLSMVCFYWGSSSSSRDKDMALLQKTK